MAGMAGVGSSLAVSSCLSALAACVIHCVGFGTDYWLEGDGYSPFLKIGLFRACFNKCTYPFCPAGEAFVYDGCWKLWDEHFMELWTWMKPGDGVNIFFSCNSKLSFIYALHVTK